MSYKKINIFKMYAPGFTLVELTVVIAVLSILFSIGTIATISTQRSSRDGARESKTKLFADSLEKYYEKNKEYPSVALVTNQNTDSARQRLDINDSDIFKFPGSSTSNSVVASNPGTSQVAYTAATTDSSVNGQCQNDLNGYCDAFQLQYKKEADNNLVTLKSRNNSFLPIAANNGAIGAPSQPAILGSKISASVVRFTASSATCQAGTVQYKIRYSTTTTLPDWSTVSWLSSNTIDINPGSNTRYYSQSLARCVNGTDISSDSAPSSVDMLDFTSTPPSNTPPGSFAVAVSSGSTSSLYISWSAPSGSSPLTYSVSYTPSGGSSQSVSGCQNISGTNCTISGLASGTYHTVYVTAINPYGSSSANSGASTDTPTQPGTAPSNFTVSFQASTTSSVSVSWTTPSGTSPIAYSVSYKPSGGSEQSFSGCQNVSSTSCTVSGLTSSTAYTIYVNATNSYGSSKMSTTGSTQSPGSAPGSFSATATAASISSINLSWTAASGAQSYNVSGAGSASSCTSSPCTITGLAEGQQYTFTVTARNANGNTPQSATATTNTAYMIVAPSTPEYNGVASISWTYGSSGYTAPNGTTYTGSGTGLNNGNCQNVASMNCTVYQAQCTTTRTITVSGSNGKSDSEYVYGRSTSDAPTQPGRFTTLNRGRQSVSFTWEASDKVVSYDWKVSQYSNDQYITGSNTTDRSATGYGLTPNTRYRAWVNASNCVGTSASLNNDFYTEP